MKFCLIKIVNLMFLAPLALILISCKEQLISELSNGESLKISTFLNTEGFESQRIKQSGNTWAIFVENRDFKAAFNLISKINFIHDLPNGITGSSSFLISENEEKLKQQQIKNALIESLLEEVPGILKAKVIINLPNLHVEQEEKRIVVKDEKFIFPEESASILLTTFSEFKTKNEDLTELISGASGVRKDHIKIIIQNANDNSKNELLKQNTENENHNIVKIETYFNYILENKIKLFFISSTLIIAGVLLYIKSTNFRSNLSEHEKSVRGNRKFPFLIHEDL